MTTIAATDLIPAQFVASEGEVFAVFDATTQDSGNLSFGVQAGARRYFVKSAGDPTDPAPFLAHANRVALLENAVRVALDVRHRCLPELRNVVAGPWGPLLVYDWVAGDLVRAPRAMRGNRDSSFQRFRALPLDALLAAIGDVVDVHARLASRGWVARIRRSTIPSPVSCRRTWSSSSRSSPSRSPPSRWTP